MLFFRRIKRTNVFNTQYLNDGKAVQLRLDTPQFLSANAFCQVRELLLMNERTDNIYMIICTSIYQRIIHKRADTQNMSQSKCTNIFEA